MSSDSNHSPARRLELLGATFAVFSFGVSFAQPVPPPEKSPPEAPTNLQVIGHIVKVNQLPPPALSSLKVPDGFRIELFAENLGNARTLAIAPGGAVYVTRREQGDVLMLKVPPTSQTGWPHSQTFTVSRKVDFEVTTEPLLN